MNTERSSRPGASQDLRLRMIQDRLRMAGCNAIAKALENVIGFRIEGSRVIFIFEDTDSSSLEPLKGHGARENLRYACTEVLDQEAEIIIKRRDVAKQPAGPRE